MALIGLLPGTFDPIHLGHVALAQAAQLAGSLDEVWLLVDAQPAQKSNVLSYQHRFAMTKLATAETPGVSATAVPMALRRLPHTMAGFAELAAARPGDRFVMIAGLDTLVQLDSWDDCERIVRTTAFLVARRPGVPSSALEALRVRLGERLGALLDVRLFDFEDYGAAASTVVRRQLRAGKQADMLTPAVYGYIRERQLYRQ